MANGNWCGGVVYFEQELAKVVALSRRVYTSWSHERLEEEKETKRKTKDRGSARYKAMISHRNHSIGRRTNDAVTTTNYSTLSAEEVKQTALLYRL